MIQFGTSLDRALPDLVIFDLEASGQFPARHEILQIGAVRVSPDLKTVRAEFFTYTQPQHIETADPVALQKIGYSPETWKNAKPLDEALAEFAAFIEGGLLAGYNVSFDWGFLKDVLQKSDANVHLDYHVFDIMSLVLADVLKSGKPQSVRLTHVLQRLGLPPQPEPHNALEDSRCALAVLKTLTDRQP